MASFLFNIMKCTEVGTNIKNLWNKENVLEYEENVLEYEENKGETEKNHCIFDRKFTKYKENQ